LREHGLPDQEEFTPWLGGVFVRPQHPQRVERLIVHRQHQNQKFGILRFDVFEHFNAVGLFQGDVQNDQTRFELFDLLQGLVLSDASFLPLPKLATERILVDHEVWRLGIAQESAEDPTVLLSYLEGRFFSADDEGFAYVLPSRQV
jgi:hypothetical protein